MFKKIKAEIKNYADQYNTLKKAYNDKIVVLKASYYGSAYYDSEFAANRDQFKKAVLALQVETKQKLNDVYSAIIKSIRSSMTDDLSLEVIAELNLIKGLKLSEFEIKGYAKKYTGNIKALRILTEIAEQNGVHFNYTSHEDILDVVKQLTNKTDSFINGYRGDYRMFGFYKGDYDHAIMINGDPIDLIEDVYNDFLNPFKGSAANG